MSDHLLPPNATPQERALSLAVARVGDIDTDLAALWRAEDCPAALLPWLAWAMSVEEEWYLCTNDDERRALIGRALELHRRKGTPWAVRTALETAGYAGAEIEEGQPVALYDGTLFHTGSDTYGGGARWALFRVLLDLGEDRGITAVEIDRIVTAIHRYKNARSHLRELAFRSDVADDMGVDDATTLSAEVTHADVKPWGLRYDGTALHAGAQRHLHDGAAMHGGSWRYDGWTVPPGGVRHDNVWDAATLRLTAAVADACEVMPAYDGAFAHEGIRYGAGNPSAADPEWVSEVGVLRHDGQRSHNGVHRYGIHRSVLHNQDIVAEVGAEDTVPVADGPQALAGRATAEDRYDWGRLHDGSLRHDQAARLRHDGASRHDGAAGHTGWRLERAEFHRHDGSIRHDGGALHAGWVEPSFLYQAARDPLAAVVDIDLGADRVEVEARYDGRFVHTGFRYGTGQPVAADPAMPILLTRYFRHDGRHRHGGDIHDGGIRFDGSHSHWAGILHEATAVAALQAI